MKTNILECLSKTSPQLSLAYIFIFSVIMFLYNRNHIVGVVFSFIMLIITCFIPYLLGYFPLTLCKVMIIIIAGLLMFATICYSCLENPVNNYSILTNLMRLNVICLIVSLYNPIFILLATFVTITTPNITVKNGEAKMKENFISVNLWVLLYALAMVCYHIYNSYLCSNLTVVTLAIIIPCILHFTSNQFLESRAIALFTFIIFDIIHNARKGWDDFIRVSKY